MYYSLASISHSYSEYLDNFTLVPIYQHMPITTILSEEILYIDVRICGHKVYLTCSNNIVALQHPFSRTIQCE